MSSSEVVLIVSFISVELLRICYVLIDYTLINVVAS